MKVTDADVKNAVNSAMTLLLKGASSNAHVSLLTGITQSYLNTIKTAGDGYKGSFSAATRKPPPWEKPDVAPLGVFLADVLGVDDGGIKGTWREEALTRGAVFIQLSAGGDPFLARMSRRSSIIKRDNGTVVEGSETGKREQPQAGDKVLVCFGQSVDNPIIIGWAPRLSAEGLFLDKNGLPEPKKRIDVHSSFWWQKLNQLGDLEICHPDGTLIRVSEDEGSAVFPTTAPSPTVDLTENRSHPNGTRPTKTVTVSHPSGTWIRIRKNGDVEMVVVGDIKKKVLGDYSLDVDGEIRMTSAAHVEITSAQDMKIQASTQIDIIAENISVSAQSQVSLLSGGSNNIVLTNAETALFKNVKTPDDFTAGHTHTFALVDSQSGPVSGTIGSGLSVNKDTYD